LRVKPTGVGPLHRHDASVTTQRLGELSASHVESIDARRTALQQDIGESAGRRANIEADPAGRIDVKGIQRRRQLLSAARDVARPRDELDRGRHIDQIARLAVPPCLIARTYQDVAGQQQGLRFRASLGQAALDQKLIEPKLLPGWFGGQAVRAS
jgi:hypothetical protein